MNDQGRFEDSRSRMGIKMAGSGYFAPPSKNYLPYLYLGKPALGNLFATLLESGQYRTLNSYFLVVMCQLPLRVKYEALDA